MPLGFEKEKKKEKNHVMPNRVSHDAPCEMLSRDCDNVREWKGNWKEEKNQVLVWCSYLFKKEWRNENDFEMKLSKAFTNK